MDILENGYRGAECRAKDEQIALHTVGKIVHTDICPTIFYVMDEKLLLRELIAGTLLCLSRKFTGNKLEGREPPLTLRRENHYLYIGHFFPCTPGTFSL